MEATLEELRYPVGRFVRPSALSDGERRAAIATLEELPAQLRAAVAGRSNAALDAAYRPGGWSVRQLVHHVADSHLNAYARTRLALTEDFPVIKPYDEAAWAELPDSKSMPLEPSLLLLDSLHQRWVVLLRALPQTSWARGYRHPEGGQQRLDQVLALYAWHSRHHLAHALGAPVC